MKPTIFTGQPILGLYGRYNVIACPICGGEVSMGEAYFDPYLDGRQFDYKSEHAKAGCYVHKHCLSEDRKIEVALEVSKRREENRVKLEFRTSPCGIVK